MNKRFSIVIEDETTDNAGGCSIGVNQHSKINIASLAGIILLFSLLLAFYYNKEFI